MVASDHDRYRYCVYMVKTEASEIIDRKAKLSVNLAN